MEHKRRSITITAEDVEGWEKEVAGLRVSIDRDTQRLQFLTRKLEALALFSSDNEPDRDKGQIQSLDTPKDLLSLSAPQFVMQVLTNTAGPLTMGDIRKKIVASGYPKEKFGVSFKYLYTFMSRLVKQGKLQKEGDKFVIRRTPVLPGVS